MSSFKKEMMSRRGRCVPRGFSRGSFGPSRAWAAVVAVAFFLGAAVELAVAFDGSFCYESTQVILLDMIDKRYDTVETYNICAGTVIQMGDIDPVTGQTVNGDIHLPVRGNMEVVCGDNGNVEDNCVFLGGALHMQSTFDIFGEIAENVVFRGITFDGATTLFGIITNAGDVSFIDCIFRNMGGLGPLIIGYSGSESRRLVADERGTLDDDQDDKVALVQEAAVRAAKSTLKERLQDSETRKENGDDGESSVDAAVAGDRSMVVDRLVVTFTRCLFENNRQLENEARAMFGVITVQSAYNDIIVEDCVFQNNVYNVGFGGIRLGYALISQGSNVVVDKSCFIDNDLAGYGTMQVLAGGLLDATDNYVTADEGLLCPFAATSDFLDASFDQIICVASDSDVCLSSLTGPSTPLPSSIPTTAVPTEWVGCWHPEGLDLEGTTDAPDIEQMGDKATFFSGRDGDRQAHRTNLNLQRSFEYGDDCECVDAGSYHIEIYEIDEMSWHWVQVHMSIRRQCCSTEPGFVRNEVCTGMPGGFRLEGTYEHGQPYFFDPSAETDSDLISTVCAASSILDEVLLLLP